MKEKNTGKGRLLVVDDEIGSLHPVCEFLDKCGYLVSGYPSAHEAIRAMKHVRYDLLLTDLIMPEMDGITLMKNAREIDPFLVGIIITGQGTVQTAVNAMKSGAFDYILKPLDMGILSQVISRAIEVRRLREAEKKYRSIFENSTGGIYQSTAEGIFITANRALARILGYHSAEELISHIKDAGQLYVQQNRRKEFMIHIQKNNIVVGLESQVYKKDGSSIWISEDAIAVHNESGTFLYYEGCVKDITDRKHAEEELRISREQLRSLSAYLQSAREEERMHIAREIHDELGQVLTALRMELSWLGGRIPDLANRTNSMSDMIDSGIKTVRKILTALRPNLLDDLGLIAALEWQAEEFQKRTGITCELVTDKQEINLERDVAVAVYRILQEALTNITKHANATLVRVTIFCRPDQLIMGVTDNGRGIPEGQISKLRSFGLTGMRERAQILGGDFSIKGLRHNGTQLEITIPLRNNRERL
jgi:PAS domain S-box-containing protein